VKDLAELLIAIYSENVEEGFQSFFNELYIKAELLSVFEQVDRFCNDQSDC